MNDKIQLENRLKEIRTEQKISQGELARMVGVSRNTISSIETGQYCPTAKLAYTIVIALDNRFEDVFYFENYLGPTSEEKDEVEVKSSSVSDRALHRIKKYLESQGWSSEKILDFIINITG
ncbi:MAG: helix-turn-helix transcriptional regulator [Clostridia bacterium]|nr:helix-turn-helix transcriptional regulator [Clostridia bacterium]